MKQLETKISPEKAAQIMKEPSNFLMKKRNIEHTELVYLPYYLYEVAVIFKNMSTMKKHIGVDCIDGEYAFLHDINILLNASNNIEYGNKIYIDEKQSEQIAQKAVKDIILMRMKKGIQIVKIETKLLQMINYPYWIGLYRKKRRIEFDAIDALSGKKQGVKMRPVLLKKIIQ